MAASNAVKSTSFIGDGNIVTNIIQLEGVSSYDDLAYLNTNSVKIADTITIPNQARFTGASILQPSPSSTLPATTINNFIFFINGQYVPSSLVSFVADGAGVRIQFDTTSLGFELETSDEITASGKFS